MLSEDKLYKRATVRYSISFYDENGEKVAENLTPYDKWVHMAVGNLYQDLYGEKSTTISKIHRMMGYTSRPSKAQINMIKAALVKMKNAIIKIDNTNEHQVIPKYPLFKYKGSLLKISLKDVVNGNASQIAIIEEPVLFAFARGRKQVEPIKMEILKTGLTHNNLYITIEDYILYRVTRHKKNKELTIKYATILDHIYKSIDSFGAKTKNKLLSITENLLNHYFDIGCINNYRFDEMGEKIVIYK